MNSHRCSNCSFLNFTTASACKRCGQPFESAPGGTPTESQWQPPGHTSTAAPPYPAPENAPYYWNQPYATGYVPPSMPASSSTTKIVGIVVSLAVISLMAFLAIPMLVKPKRTDFTKVTWTEYKSPDNRFSISLPVTPKISQVTMPTPVGNTQVQVFEAEVSKEGGCMLMHADYPVSEMKISEESLYDTALAGATSRQKQLNIGARKYITVDGYRGIEAELTPANPKVPGAGGVRLFWVSPRLYIVLAAGPSTPEFKAVQTRCLESFRLGGK